MRKCVTSWGSWRREKPGDVRMKFGYPYNGNISYEPDFLSQATLVWRPASGIFLYQVLLLQPS